MFSNFPDFITEYSASATASHISQRKGLVERLHLHLKQALMRYKIDCLEIFSLFLLGLRPTVREKIGLPIADLTYESLYVFRDSYMKTLPCRPRQITSQSCRKICMV